MPAKSTPSAPNDSTTRRLAIMNLAWSLPRRSETETGGIEADLAAECAETVSRL